MTALAEVAEIEHERLPVRRAASNLRAVPSRVQSSLADNLHVLTCGSVDDGKSTLIGRLLWDAGALHADQRQAIERAPKTAAGTPDFSRLVDGLAAEREQGITIDIAWRYFDIGRRRLVIIDSPGHEQYTRNMATGASHADVAILLVDARSGIKVQTRRHAAILHLMGVERVVLAVNKMDLIDWSESHFHAIEGEFLALAGRHGFHDAIAIPVSAVHGDNVAHRSSIAHWYDGPALFEFLQQVPARQARSHGDFRFPVQLVVRAGQDFRGLAGTVASGEIAVGNEVVDAATGRSARIRRIVVMGRDLEVAHAGQAVVVQLDRDLDLSRGAVLAMPDQVPAPVRTVDAQLVWLSDEPFDPKRGYLLRSATDLVPVSLLEIAAQLDLADLSERPASTCTANDIARVRLTLARGTVLEPFADHQPTGSFVVIDAITGATVAGGVITGVPRVQQDRPHQAFTLTRDLLKQGLGADLGNHPGSEEELRRRANEVAALLRAAGVSVELEDKWAGPIADATTVWMGVLMALSFGFVSAILFGAV
jgi:bifunctional enzyme CysN/CysC